MPAVRVRRGRAGMTLIEIMISLVLLGIVSGVVMRVVMRQQRFYQGVNQIMTQRGQLRQATSILPIDLRSLSSIGNDVIVASDSSLEFMVNVGTGIVCQTIGGNKVALPPLALDSKQTLTSWYGYGPPDPAASEYTVYIYNDSSIVGNEDDRWQKFTLTGVATSLAYCLPGPGSFTKAVDLGQQRPVLELSSTEPNDPVTMGPLSQYIGAGAPVRVLKRVRYKLYQHSDGQWYLGFAACTAACSVGSGTYEALAPVSGPYDAYSTSSGTPTGFGFRYYDVDGVEIPSGSDAAARARIARVDLIARARTSGNVRAAGIQNGATQQYRDSLAVSVMLRNRN